MAEGDAGQADEGRQGETNAGHHSGDGQQAENGNNNAETNDDEAQERIARRKPMIKRIAIIVGIVVLIIAAIWAFHWFTKGRYMEGTNNAYLRADQVLIAPKVAGYVTDVMVSDNQQVEANQPLLRIDLRQYRAATNQALATIEARQADITRAEAEVRQQQATVEQAQAQLVSALANESFARREVARYQPLAASGADTGERLSQLRNNLAQAQAQVKADRAALDAAQRQITTQQAQITQARAQLTAAKESAREARIDLDDTVVRSSIAGRVGDKTVRVGQFVQPGTRLMTIVPTSGIYLVANFKETQITQMRIGQPATIHVDAFPDLELHGRVESFAPGTGAQFALLPPENATGNFTKIVQRVPVRISVQADKRAEKLLLPGLSVEVTVDTRGNGQ